MRQNTQPISGSAPTTRVAMLVEGAIRLVWLTLQAGYAVAAHLARNLWLAAASAAIGAVLWRFGPGVALVVVALVGASLVGWRLRAPASFQRLAAPRLAAMWRGPWYRLRWTYVASRCGLVAWPRGTFVGRGRDRKVPRLRRLRFAGSGIDRLLLRLPVGLTPDDVASRADAVAHAFRAEGARVVLDRPGRVWLELRRHDPLGPVIAPLGIGEVTLAGIPIGLGDDDRPWRFRVEGTHALIAGATGAGKGSVLWSLLNGLAPAIRDRWVQVWALDPKGGMELGLGRGVFERFEGGVPEAMCDLLEEAVDLKTRRSLALATDGVRKHTPSPDSPHIIVVIDELATLTAFAERTVVRRIEQALGLLLTQGRAVGITVIAAVQDPGKDVVSWRDLFPTRIAMRLDNPVQVDMVLGDGARERGALADHISELTPGVAYVRTEGTRDIRRVRSAYLTDDDIVRLSRDLAAAHPQPATGPDQGAVA